MKVTIVTLYRGRTAETYVSAVAGEMTEADRAGLVATFEVVEDDEDMIGFQTVELAGTPGDLREVLQAFP